MVYLVLLGIWLFFPQAVTAQVVINEFSADPDWVEIYNTSPVAVDLNSWSITDAANTGIGLSGTIGPHAFLSYIKSSWLNDNPPETITLKNSTGEVVDVVSYGVGSSLTAPQDNHSWGRFPDGSSSWVAYSQTTQGQPNLAPPSPTPTPTPTPTSTPTPTATPTPVPLEIQIVYLPGSIQVGQPFTLGFSASSLKSNTDYCVKAYGGIDTDNYGIVTQNGANWYDLTTACYLLPKFKSTDTGTLSNNLTVKVKEGKEAGTYNVKVKIIEVSGSTFKESSPSTITVSPGPTPTPTQAPTVTPSVTLTPSPFSSPTPAPETTPLPEPETFLTPSANGDMGVMGISDVIKPTPTPGQSALNFSSIINFPVLLLVGGGLLLLAPLAVSLIKHG